MSQQQCVSPYQLLYKRRNPNWRNELRQNFIRRLEEEREISYNRTRKKFERLVNNLLFEKIIRDETKSLRISEHVTDDELNEAIQEFERFRDEVVQQEIDSMIAYEQERLEDLASAENSVLCPRCQLANLNFPDEYTLNCERCHLQLRLMEQLPSPLELTTHFTNIFTSHADRDCPETPVLILQDTDKLFLRCHLCAFDSKIF
uniref:RPA-interacting protein C-terminal domain-containing protein n=1 Tax=Setaria digitata TaxID=48799 RepID=A0A915PJM2_9BILA